MATKAKTGGLSPYKNAAGKRIGWTVSFYNHRGERRTKKLKGATKPEAQEVWMEKMSRARLEFEGVRKLAERMTLDEAADEAWEARAGNAASTMRTQVGVYKRHIQPYLGRKKLIEVDMVCVQNWFNKLLAPSGRQKARTKATAHRAEKVLTLIVHSAASRGAFGPRQQHHFVKPWAGLKKPKLERHGRPGIVTAPQFGRLIKSAYEVGGSRAALVCGIACFAGNRRGEFPHMTWDKEVTFMRGGEGVTGAAIAGADTLQIWTSAEVAKNNRFRINLITAPEVVALASRHRFSQREWARVNGLPDPEAVFIARRAHGGRPAGRPMPRPISDREWPKIRDGAQLVKNFRFHDLRGSYAKMLLRNGASLEVVREMLGHKDIETTQRYIREIGGIHADGAAAAISGMSAGVDLGGMEAEEYRPPERVPEVATAAEMVQAAGPSIRPAKDPEKGLPFSHILRIARTVAGLNQVQLGKMVVAEGVPGTAGTWQRRLSSLENGSWEAKTPESALEIGKALALLLDEPRLRFVPQRGLATSGLIANVVPLAAMAGAS